MTEQPSGHKGGLNPDFKLGQSIDEKMQEVGDFPLHSAVDAARRLADLDDLKTNAVVGLKEKNEELVKESITDSKTGLLNARGLEEAYVRLGEISANRRRYTDAPPSHTIMFMDLDHFKDINEAIGHDNADKVLAVVGQFLKGTLREKDVVGRWGGDEFIAMLPDTDPEQAAIVAGRVREAIASITEVEGFAVSPSASIGLGPMDLNLPLGQAVTQADEAMYAAKEAGRNQVVIFGAEAA